MHTAISSFLEEHGPENTIIFWDVDLCLMNTMSTDTQAWQQELFENMCDITTNVLASGRQAQSMDTTIQGKLPLSSEQNSAIRLKKGGDLISLAPKIDTHALAQEASRILSSQATLVTSPQQVWDAYGKSPVVYPEVKDYSVALVHSLEHGDVEKCRDTLVNAANTTIKNRGLTETHRVAVGSDAVEVVPNGVDPFSPARFELSIPVLAKLQEEGLNKATAVHIFMSLPENRGKIPLFVGDSGTDGDAMNVCFNVYGGGGAWVKNNKDVPSNYVEAVQGRIIGDYNESWQHVQHAVNTVQPARVRQLA